ncbi:hypothetical protein ACIOC2_33700, partial [Streptomyces sp. NPDC088337]
GFTEHGLQPAPQALLSILAETGTLLLLAIWQAVAFRRRSAASPAGAPVPGAATWSYGRRRRRP